ncbi:MAG: sulfurtransferase complex subunit TusB [Cellvibrionaceae bacterium]
MMTQTILHTVNQSPFNKNTLQECINFYRKNDAIVLLENGVYGALDSQPFANELKHKQCYAVKSDIHARGLNTSDSLIENIQIIDYQQFVQLVTKFNNIQNWY